MIRKQKVVKLILHVYQTARGGWRWQAKTTNGRIVAASTESYVRRRKCANNAAFALGLTNTARELVTNVAPIHGPFRVAFWSWR